jgi:hypothetical protein
MTYRHIEIGFDPSSNRIATTSLGSGSGGVPALDFLKPYLLGEGHCPSQLSCNRATDVRSEVVPLKRGEKRPEDVAVSLRQAIVRADYRALRPSTLA